MYESPITIFEGISRQIVTEKEDGIVAQIQQQYGVEVNKDELTKALLYDRGQYDKGYRDGMKSRWIPIDEQLPPPYKKVLMTVKDGNGVYVICKAWNGLKNVIAWMPVPEPYEEI